MANNLTCSASNCAFNNSGACYAGGINVHGAHAKTTSNTTCASFQDKNVAGFTNCSNDCDCVGTEDIKCGACECTHNENECCKAPSVQINAQNASCETFRC